MHNLSLIIISGPSATGKTTLAKKLSEELKLPLITRDSIKELLFDELGWSDREWSHKLGTSSVSFIFYFLDSLLSVNVSLIVENSFHPQFDIEKLLERKARFNFYPIQIMCKSNGEVLFERFKKRSESGERHPGHRDHLNYEEFKGRLLKGFYDPLEIGGEIIEFDSTDLENIDYRDLFTKVKVILKQQLE